MAPQPIDDYTITGHALWEMSRRGISEGVVRRVLAGPGQRSTLRPGRDVLQALFKAEGREYLIRVFVDVDRHPAEVVTAYRTSKVSKYWREEP